MEDIKTEPIIYHNLLSRIVYPGWAWEGTLYAEFAEACTKYNHIPARFFVEALKTVTGAICSQRIIFPYDPSMEPRFYTVLLSDRGGVGKSTVGKWAMKLFENSGLLTTGGAAFDDAVSQVGCWHGGFGSGVGMLKRLVHNNRVLQESDEVAGLIEKIGISGSGAHLLGILNTLYEETVPPTNETKDSNVSFVPPKDCHLSLLACGIKSKWDEAFGSTSAENSGFFQRLNIVYVEEIETVPMLLVPNLDKIRDALILKIQALDNKPLVLCPTTDAETFLDAWWERLKVETKDEPSDVTGRINSIVIRNALHIAWLLDSRDEKGEPAITHDVMMRATALGDYQWRIRAATRPTPGKNDTAKMEATIVRILKKDSPLTRSQLYLKSNASRVGLDVFNRAIENLKREGLIRVVTETTAKGETTRGYKTDVIHWKG